MTKCHVNSRTSYAVRQSRKKYFSLNIGTQLQNSTINRSKFVDRHAYIIIVGALMTLYIFRYL